MEGGESLLDTLFDEENDDVGRDVEMLNVEEGELICQTSKTEVGDSCNGGADNGNGGIQTARRGKVKTGEAEATVNYDASVNYTNRFLGRRSFCFLANETLVDEIQSCGGQKTTDGRLFRNGGGILWSIIKVRDQGKEFEQFK